MVSLDDEILLRRFRLCRADLIAALGKSPTPPDTRTLRELADLQLAIMATEAAISDKCDPGFLSEFKEQAAA